MLNPTVNHSELDELLDGCRRQDRSSQHRLYTRFYNYAMTVASRYVGSLDVAEEVVNDAFFKVFTKLDLFKPGGEGSFRGWLRRIVINTAIDRLRSALTQPPTQAWDASNEPSWDSGIVERLTEEQVIGMLDQLPPAYRTVFNLFVVDGYSHEEIADLLGIVVGTSKSNLARARGHLKVLLAGELELTRKV